MEESEKIKNLSQQLSIKHQKQGKRSRISSKSKIKIKALDNDQIQHSKQTQNVYDQQQVEKKAIKQVKNIPQREEKKKLTFSNLLQKQQQPIKLIPHLQTKKQNQQNIQDHKKEQIHKVISNELQKISQKIVDKYQVQISPKKPILNTHISPQKTPRIEQTPQIKSIKSIKNNDQQQDQTDNISRKTRQTFKSTRSSCQDYLQHVFNYYCKLSYPLAKDPTFQQIDSTTKTMKITNFMIFCRDFRIRQQVERQKIVQIFKKHSYFHKYLKSQQFHNAVKQLANDMFETYEEDKRFGKMLVFLQIHNSFSFVRKMNQLGVVFRMKNKRGIQVNLTPKYTFKLTPNNGKSQQQIALQVKQRSQLRQLIKEQKSQWHRKNKLNKIDQLYRKGAQNKLKNKKKDKNTKTNVLNKYLNSSQSKAQLKKNTISQIQTGRVCKGYYNPCEIFSPHADKTYIKINQLKKKHFNSETKYQNRINSDRNSFFKSQTSYQIQARDLKLNEVITMAKNTIKQQQINCYNQNTARSRQFGYIKKQNKENFNPKQFVGNDQLAYSKYIPNNISVSRITNSNPNKHRDSRQLKLAQLQIQKQLKNIPQTIYQSQVIPKQFLRATRKIDKQNIRQMSQLEQMIGINNQCQDQILERHFNIQKNYEQKMNKKEDNKL